MSVILKCENCGAPLDQKTYKCEYCQTQYQKPAQPVQPVQPTANSAPQPGQYPPQPQAGGLGSVIGSVIGWGIAGTLLGGRRGGGHHHGPPRPPTFRR